MFSVNLYSRVSVQVIVAIACLCCGSVAAQTFTVNTSADTEDVDTGNGVCADSNGKCSLRAAIQTANQLPGSDTVVLRALTYTLSRSGAGEDLAVSGDLDINDHLTLRGAGSSQTIIDARGIDRIFDIKSFVNVTINGLTASNGSTSGSGAGIQVSSGATLDISDCIVSGNKIINTTGSGSGGGIFGGYDAKLGIDTCSIINNDAGGGYGGGVMNHSLGTLTMTNSIIQGNRAYRAGGIANRYKSNLTIDNTLIFDNAAAYGGAIASMDGRGSVVVKNSTISGNRSGRAGGAFSTDSGTVEIINSTITNNRSALGLGAISSGGAVTIRNSILAGNVNRNGVVQNCNGTIISQGYNLLGNNAGCNFVPAQGDLIGTAGNPISPLLASLTDNGGSILSHALLPDSPAIDAGNPLTPGSGGNACERNDQRGVSRINRGACDIGAFETTGGGDVWVTLINDNDVPPGRELIQQVISVGNKGPNKVSGIKLSINLPIGSQNIDIAGDDWSCVPNANTIYCGRSTLNSQTESILVMQFTPPFAGKEIFTQASISTVSEDPINSNDLAQLTTIVNTAPVVTTQRTVEYKPGGSVYIATDARIVDVDDSLLMGATIQFSQGYRRDEDALVLQGSGSIVSQWQAETGTLTLSGEDTIAAYEYALRTVIYENTASSSKATQRGILITVRDAYADSSPPLSVALVFAGSEEDASTDSSSDEENSDDEFNLFADDLIDPERGVINVDTNVTSSEAASGKPDKWASILLEIKKKQGISEDNAKKDESASGLMQSGWANIKSMNNEDTWLRLEDIKTRQVTSDKKIAAISASTVFFVGTISLYVRAGGILGLLFSFPLWTHIDPTPMLLLTGKERRRRKRNIQKIQQQEDRDGRIKMLLDNKKSDGSEKE